MPTVTFFLIFRNLLFLPIVNKTFDLPKVLIKNNEISNERSYQFCVDLNNLFVLKYGEIKALMLPPRLNSVKNSFLTYSFQGGISI